MLLAPASTGFLLTIASSIGPSGHSIRGPSTAGAMDGPASVPHPPGHRRPRPREQGATWPGPAYLGRGPARVAASRAGHSSLAPVGGPSRGRGQGISQKTIVRRALTQRAREHWGGQIRHSHQRAKELRATTPHFLPLFYPPLAGGHPSSCAAKKYQHCIRARRVESPFSEVGKPLPTRAYRESPFHVGPRRVKPLACRYRGQSPHNRVNALQILRFLPILVTEGQETRYR